MNSFVNPNSLEQGARLKTLREKTCLSRNAFARKYGFAPTTLQKWEEGSYQKGLSKEIAAKLIQAFLAEGIHCEKEWLLLGSGVEPYQIQHSQGSTLLEESPEVAELNIFEKTIQNADRNKIDRQLYDAVSAGKYEQVKHYIEDKHSNLHLKSGLQLHYFDNDENTLLHIAATKEYIDIAEFLLNKGTNVDVKNRRRCTPLHFACYSKQPEMIQLLLKYQANVDAIDDEGGTPLSWAAYIGNVEIANFLLKSRAHIHSTDVRGYTPLHWACHEGRFEMIKFLIRNNADKNKKSSQSERPIDLACQNGFIDAVIFLMED